MAERFFIKPPLGRQAVLEGAEAHHLAHVMRARVGDEVILFDGQGCEFAARITAIRRGAVELAVAEGRALDREPALRLSVAAPLPKGDRQRWLIEKLVEIGVVRYVPLVTQRSVVEPSVKSVERLRRTVIEASKQSGRTRLMELAEPCRWHDFAQSAAAEEPRIVAHPGGASMREFFGSGFVAGHVVGRITVAVGPEGGFSDAEIELAIRSGWRSVDLGPRILRIETAAVVLATLAIWLGELRGETPRR